MKQAEYKVVRYDADEGKVFDWIDLAAHTIKDSDGNEVVNHLYAKTIFLSLNDSMDNYIEIDMP